MWKKYWKAAVVFFNCLAILGMIYVIVGSAKYTVLLGDDFCTGTQVGISQESFLQYIGMSFRYMKDMYLTWQGCYSSMFIQALLSPINHSGLPQLRGIMIINALLFFGSLFGVVWTIFDFVWKEEKKPGVRLTVLSLLLFAVLDTRVFTEIFFWYTGALGYNFPLSFGLFGAMFFLLSNNERYSGKAKNLFAVLSAVLLFLASGGSLAVAGTECYLILLLVLAFFLVDKKISVRNIIVAAAGIVGAFINVLAPGNYIRHEKSGNGILLLFQSVKWAVRNVWTEIERLTKTTLFGVLLLAMVLIGIYLSNRLQGIIKEYGIVSILALAIGYVTTFPVALGYGGSELPNRCYFILDVVLVLSLSNFAVFIGCCLDKWARIRENKSVCAALGIMLFAVLVCSPETFSDSALMQVAKSMRNGTYENYYNECKAIYDYLATCPEENVVIPMPAYIENFECFYFDDDETAWVNVGIAEYYHKESVKRKNL